MPADKGITAARWRRGLRRARKLLKSHGVRRPLHALTAQTAHNRRESAPRDLRGGRSAHDVTPKTRQTSGSARLRDGKEEEPNALAGLAPLAPDGGLDRSASPKPLAMSLRAMSILILAPSTSASAFLPEAEGDVEALRKKRQCR